MTKEGRIDLYKKFMEKVDRDGKDELLNWLINESDFFTAPASVNFHNNYDGGLFDHSRNVVEIARNLNNFGVKNYNTEEISLEKIIICGLHHDLCKTNFYYKDKECWVKNEKNKWFTYEGYKINDSFPLGHGEKSLYYIDQFMKLEKDEMLAIRYHMGTFTENVDKYCLENSMKIPLVHLIHLADVTTGLYEKSIDYKSLALKTANANY